MKNQNILLATIIVICVCTGSIIATAVQTGRAQQQSVKRVERPTFTRKDWDNIFFENLFEQGLVGARPQNLKASDAALADNNTPQNDTTVADSSGDPSGGFAWSTYISRESVENEIKKLQLELEKDVTTPVKFKSEYGKARQSFSLLSMLFGVIHEYDGDIRWSKYAGPAQVSFARAAANARVGSQQAYQSAKRRKDELQELVRGGTFTGDEKEPESMEWPLVVDRSPIMIRLEAAAKMIKPSLSNKTEFVGNIDAIKQDAEMIAAMAQVLIREDMEEFDEDEYREFALAMSKAATDLAAATNTRNYESASSAFNIIQQSCSNCHETYN